MTHPVDVAENEQEFRELFNSLSENNQDRAMIVLRALVFAQNSVANANQESA